MKKTQKDKIYHPATHGGAHFIFSPEAPRVKPKIDLRPEETLALLRSWGETVEDTHGNYGGLERSFIVHDPKNIDKLHNLASNLGQESAIHSKDGTHEMHYYNGINAGKVRLGSGSQVFDEKPDSNYTKVTDQNNNHSYFTHNFDWDDKNLKNKITKSQAVDTIFKALSDKDYDRFKFQKYWDLILDSYIDNPLEKSLSIRTDQRVFVSMDGDNIGASVERAAMADDLQTIIQQSKTIMDGQKLIRQWAKGKDADIYIDGGDDIAFTLPATEIKSLDQLRMSYYERTGFTVTIGVGDSISRAGHAMLYGKLKGKNQVNQWKPEIDKELKEISQELSPQEKMQQHGLIKKREDLLPGGLADKKKPSDFDRDSLREGIKVELEHTDDPNIAIEIAMDHLTEDPDYYKKLKTIEKAEAPPSKPGQESGNGLYVSKHHKGAGIQAWHYKPEIASNYDKFIDQSKDSFIAKHPPEHQKVVSDFIDSVRGDFNRHFVISRDSRNGPDKVRARHVRGLMQGDSNYELRVHGPDQLSFTSFERHGNTPKSSTWNFTTKTPQVNPETTDKGYRTATGGHYVSKSDSSIPSPRRSGNRSLENDTRAVWGISELVQYRRHYGVSRGGSSLIKTSQNGNTRLVHYGVHPGLESIDPDHMGTGLGSRGAESKHGKPEVARSYYYREGSDPESVITSIGKARYTAELQPHHKLYDIGADPDGIHSKLKSSGKTRNKGIVTSDEYLQSVKDAGHYGFYNSTSHLPNAVALFYKHPVVEDKTYKKYDKVSLDLQKTGKDTSDDQMDGINPQQEAKAKIPTLDDHSDHQGKKVFVYFNLHKNLWSVRHNGKVLFHSNRVNIDNAKLKVSESGRQRVLREKSKNVHAGVEGILSAPAEHDAEPTQISYNPYKAGHFYHAKKDPESTPVHHASHVDMRLANITTPDGTQMNIPNVLAHNPKHGGFAIKQDGKKVSHDDLQFNKPSPEFMKSDNTYIWSMLEDIEKSKNIKEQKKKVFGSDANAPRTSDKRRKMMQVIQAKTKKDTGFDMKTAQGKRTPSGKLRNPDVGIQKKPFDVFTQKGTEEEKQRLEQLRIINEGRVLLGLPPLKRTDPKPDWRGGDLETQPSPDAAIHELSHLYLAPEGETIEDTQESMDKEWGDSQKKYGHMQQKKTAGEVQPMALENKLRRRYGLPAHSSVKNIKPIEELDSPVEDTVDGSGPRFTRGIKYVKKTPQSADYVRSSRLLSPENQKRLDMIDSGELVYDKDRGWVEGTSVNSKINERARIGPKAYFKRKLEEIKANQGIEEPLASSDDEKIKALKQKYFGTGESEQEAHNKRIAEVKRKFKSKINDQDPMKINMKISARDMKKADEPRTLDYSKINQITRKPESEAPVLNYSKINQVNEKPHSPTLDYSKINQITRKPESPPLDYSKMKSPAAPSASEKAAATNKRIARESSMTGLEEVARRTAANKAVGPTTYTADMLPVSEENKKSKIAKYFRSKLKIS